MWGLLWMKMDQESGEQELIIYHTVVTHSWKWCINWEYNITTEPKKAADIERQLPQYKTWTAIWNVEISTEVDMTKNSVAMELQTATDDVFSAL